MFGRAGVSAPFALQPTCLIPIMKRCLDSAFRRSIVMVAAFLAFLIIGPDLRAGQEVAGLETIGTSGKVYPAAGFVELARHAGAHTVELNLEPSDGSPWFAEHRHGPATATVPAYVEELLQKSQQA